MQTPQARVTEPARVSIRQSIDGCALLLRSSPKFDRDSAALKSAAADAVVATHAQLPGLGCTTQVLSDINDDVYVVVMSQGSPKAAAEWVQTFASVLAEHGFDGYIDRPVDAPIRDELLREIQSEYVPTLFLAFRSVNDMHSSTAQLFTRLGEGASSVRLSTCGSRLRLPLDDRLSQSVNSLNTQASAIFAGRQCLSVIGWSPDPAGQVAVGTRRPNNWRAQVALLRDVALEHASSISYGFIRFDLNIPAWDLVATGKPTAPTGVDNAGFYYQNVWKRWWPGKVADAHGLQILTSEHLSLAHDLSSWNVTELTDGRYLVEAKDLEAWFGVSEIANPLSPQLPRIKVPVPEIVTRARTDFGKMIVTADQIESVRRRDVAERRAAWQQKYGSR